MKRDNRMTHSKQKITPLQDLTLLDRFLFSEAVEDEIFLSDLLSIIMEEDIVLKTPPQTEKEIRSSNLRKYVKLNVFAEDEQDRIYDTEVQKQNTGNLPLHDGGYRIFLNTHGTDTQNISPELKALLDFFENPTEEMAVQSGSERIQRMQKRVKTLKDSEEVGAKYMREWEERAIEKKESYEQGRVEGLAEEKLNTARKMLQEGLDIDLIIKITGLTKEEISVLDV